MSLALGLTRAALAADGAEAQTALALQARALLAALLAALRSPLAAPHVPALYLRLRTALLPPRHHALAATIAAVTLRYVAVSHLELFSSLDNHFSSLEPNRVNSKLRSLTRRGKLEARFRSG